MSRKIFTGIIPALYTCYHEDGSVNYKETVRLFQWLCEKGAGGFYLCGSTGDGLLLTMNERKQIVESVSQAIEGSIALMVHVGCMSTSDSIELARHAAGCKGVQAISSLPPQYYPMPLTDHVKHLSSIARASDLPFYPYLFSEAVDAHGVPALLDAFGQIPNMAGIKAFVHNLAVHQEILINGPKEWELLHGFDQCLFHALCIPGVDGAIGSTYNVLPEVAVSIYDSVVKKDFEQAILMQQRLADYWLTAQRGVVLPVGRCILQKRGFQTGPPRAPLCPPDPELVNQVEQQVKSNFHGEWSV